MTVFYSERDDRLLEEKRIRRIAEEVAREVMNEGREPAPPPGYLRTINGDLVHEDDAMGRRK